MNWQQRKIVAVLSVTLVVLFLGMLLGGCVMEQAEEDDFYGDEDLPFSPRREPHGYYGGGDGGDYNFNFGFFSPDPYYRRRDYDWYEGPYSYGGCYNCYRQPYYGGWYVDPYPRFHHHHHHHGGHRRRWH